MKIKEYINNKRAYAIIKWSLLTTTIFIIFFIIILSINLTINHLYKNTFLPKTSISGINIGRLNIEEAKKKIETKIDFINRRGFIYTNNIKTVIIYPTIKAIEADTSYPLVSWQVDESLNSLLKLQDNNNLLNLFNKIKTIITGKNYNLLYTWDKEQHLEILKDNLNNLLQEKQEAYFNIIGNEIEIIPEQIGQTFNFEQALKDTELQIINLNNQDIKLIVIEDRPIITLDIINNKSEEILETINKENLFLIYKEDQWGIDKEVWNNSLVIKNKQNEYYLGINKIDFINSIEDIKLEIENEVQDAKFEMENNKVTEFISNKNGVSINIEKTILILEEAIKNNAPEFIIPIITEIIEPKIKNNDVNNLGIIEIIGVGESNFYGSPYNRIHNITIGSNTIHGTLIAPGEEFSLINTLGEIDGEHGYKQELVIKGDETIPEFGGGLCQVGTTMFRAAIQTGLPITQRRNHSYRVSYYEPAGTDATIYNPWPDLKFLNDTDNHILIQTRIIGTKLYFDFWGTSDNREMIITEPVIYNIVAPPEKKIIKTLELEIGEEKCTERAHNGADAKFDYIVQYEDIEDPIETTFYSHYIPWQEVCLLGVTEEEYEEYQNSLEEEIEEN